MTRVDQYCDCDHPRSVHMVPDDGSSDRHVCFAVGCPCEGFQARARRHGDRPCVCGHREGHHAQALIFESADRKDPIGMQHKCLEDPECTCERFVPADWMARWLPDDTMLNAVRAMHAHTSLMGARMILLVQCGNVANMYTNASDAEHVPDFVRAMLASREKMPVEVEQYDVAPVPSRIDPADCIEMPPLTAETYRHYPGVDDVEPWGEDDFDEYDDDAGEGAEA